MRVFAIRDKAWLGRGVFAVFSTADKAEQFLDRSAGIVRQCGQVAELPIIAEDSSRAPSRVFAAYLYDDLHDSHILDGLYEDAAVAGDVAGRKGHVVELVIDSPEESDMRLLAIGGHRMDFLKIVEERKSVRAFKPDPVPEETVRRVLAAAAQAPSAINLQPWEFLVVAGEERKRLSRRLIKAYREKNISCSPGNVKPLASTFTSRGIQSFEAMKPYLDEMGSDFNRFVNEGSCNFYGAPVAVILCLDNAFSKARYVDVGIALGYLVLAAHDCGLQTCPIGLITAYEEDVKDALDISENKDVVISVALGYADWDSPINRFRSSKEDPQTFIRWIE